MNDVLTDLVFLSVFIGVTFFLAPRLIAEGIEWFVLWRVSRKDGTTLGVARKRYIKPKEAVRD